MNKKGDIKPRDWIIASGIFVMLFSSLMWIIAEAQKEDATFVDTDELTNLNNTFNKFDEYNATVTRLQSNIQGIGAGEGPFGFLDNLINLGWNTLKLLGQEFNFMFSAITGLTTTFGIPAFITLTFIAIISIIFVSAILGVIFNRSV